MISELKDLCELPIYKNSEYAGILQRTALGCELKLAPTFIANTSAPYFSYCIPKTTPHLITRG